MVGPSTRVTAVRSLLLPTVWLTVATLAVWQLLGPTLAKAAQTTPTTTSGWLVIGWLMAGPAYLLAYLTWAEFEQLRPSRRRERLLIVAGWLIVSTWLLPARLVGVEPQFGSATDVGAPLLTGWSWAAGANLLGIGFAALLLSIRRRSRAEVTVGLERVTTRFIEWGWVVALATSFTLMLYTSPW